MTNGTALRPHRGTLVLVLGILGLVCCFPCGIVAWVLGNQDIRDMNAGTMDPTGLGMTKAGKIIGMIGVIVNVLWIAGWLLFTFVFAAASAVQN